MDIFNFNENVKRRKTIAPLESFSIKQTCNFSFDLEDCLKFTQSKTPELRTFTWKNLESAKRKRVRKLPVSSRLE